MSERTQGVHAYLLQVQGDEAITDTQLMNAVKRINDRIYQLEKIGATDSIAFKRYKQYAGKHGGISTTKGGRSKLSLTKKDLSAMDDKARKELLALDRNGGSWGKEKKKAMDYLTAKHGKDYYKKGAKLTDEQIKEIVETTKELGDLHDFIMDNSDIIYDVENVMGNFVRGNNGELTPDEVDRVYKIKAEWEKLNKEGKFDGKVTMAKAEDVAERQTYNGNYTPFRD